MSKDNQKNLPCRIAIFASGNGSNAQRIIDESRASEWGEVGLVLSDHPKAKVLGRAADAGITCKVLNKEERSSGKFLNAMLRKFEISLIVLAGYLKLIPPETVTEFPGKIINIHPALLPDYGGKGMFGMNVHEAVLRNKEEFSGITIHLIDEYYDQGEILYQKKIRIEDAWTPEDLATEIHKLEHEHFPRIIRSICLTPVALTI